MGFKAVNRLDFPFVVMELETVLPKRFDHRDPNAARAKIKNRRLPPEK